MKYKITLQILQLIWNNRYLLRFYSVKLYPLNLKGILMVDY